MFDSNSLIGIMLIAGLVLIIGAMAIGFSNMGMIDSVAKDTGLKSSKCSTMRMVCYQNEGTVRYFYIEKTGKVVELHRDLEAKPISPEKEAALDLLRILTETIEKRLTKKSVKL